MPRLLGLRWCDGEGRGITEARHQACPTPQEPLLEPLQPLICRQKRNYQIYALAILPSPDGTAPRILTGPYESGKDASPINVWESDTGAVTHSLTGHEACVTVLTSYELEPGHGHVRLASAHGTEGGGMLVL
jgi:hypothetical protein